MKKLLTICHTQGFPAVVLGGGNALLRASALETMFEGDVNFRNGIANNPTNTSNLTNLDINNYLNTGHVRSRTVSLERMSREQLLNYLRLIGNNNTQQNLGNISNNN